MKITLNFEVANQAKKNGTYPIYLRAMENTHHLYSNKSLPNFVFTEKRKANGTEHLSSLIYAIKNSFIAEFFYLKYDNTYSHVRKVEPYALKEFKGRWYLLAMEIDGKLEERGMTQWTTRLKAVG